MPLRVTPSPSYAPYDVIDDVIDERHNSVEMVNIIFPSYATGQKNRLNRTELCPRGITGAQLGKKLFFISTELCPWGITRKEIIFFQPSYAQGPNRKNWLRGTRDPPPPNSELFHTLIIDVVHEKNISLPN